MQITNNHGVTTIKLAQTEGKEMPAGRYFKNFESYITFIGKLSCQKTEQKIKQLSYQNYCETIHQRKLTKNV